MLPIPANAPGDLPRIILESSDKVWRCEISDTRVNFFWRRVSNEIAELAADDFYRLAATLFGEYVESSQARVGRLAAVITRYFPIDSPGAFLARHFCRSDWLSEALADPGNFELHAHKVFTLASRFRVNSWVRNKTGQLRMGGGQSTGIIVVEQDLNSLAEQIEESSFSSEDLTDFFVAVPSQFDDILQRYYPPAS